MRKWKARLFRLLLRRKYLIDCEILDHAAVAFIVDYIKVRLPTIGDIQSRGVDIMSLVILHCVNFPPLENPMKIILRTVRILTLGDIRLTPQTPPWVSWQGITLWTTDNEPQ
jgi:hypothetical protein